MMEKLKGTKHKFTKTSFCILKISQKHKTTKDTDKKNKTKKEKYAYSSIKTG